MDHIVLIQSFVEGHLGHFYLSAVVNHAATNMSSYKYLFLSLLPVLWGFAQKENCWVRQ